MSIITETDVIVEQALEESGNSIQQATEWLRKKGALKAAKKADRVRGSLESGSDAD